MEAFVTTGEQSVSATGAITGTLSTVTVPSSAVLFCRVRGLTGSQNIRIDIEDTASATAFSDSTQVATFDFQGAQNPDGDTRSLEFFRMPSLRFGATNNAIRGNTQVISASTTALVEIWISY